MDIKPDVYLFGQVLGTHSFLLKGGFLQPDEYAEIGAQYFLPGGETGTAATVMLQAFYLDRKVDLSPLHIWKDDPGVMDYVVIAGLVRSPMGRFQTLFSSGKRWWSIPQEKDIVDCKAVAIDPFFGKESLQAMEICRKHGIPYVTIDSPHDSPLHQHAAVNVVSKECTGQYYADIKPEAVMERLMETAEGLTILTQGGGDMLYGRKDAALHRMKPFDVEVRSTLGAGDTFKAGCVYGLLHGMADDALVRFASACSAMAISRFPLPLHPPKLEEVRALIDMQKE